MGIIAIQSSFLLGVARKPLTFGVYFVYDNSSVFNQILDKLMIWLAFLLCFSCLRNTSVQAITIRNATQARRLRGLRKTGTATVDNSNVGALWNHVATMKEWYGRRFRWRNHLKLVLDTLKLYRTFRIKRPFFTYILARCSAGIYGIIQITDCLLACKRFQRRWL